MSNTNNMGNTLLKRQMTKKNGVKEISERQRIILELIIANPFLSAKAISEKTSEKVSEKVKQKMIANKEYVINKLNELSLYAKKNFGQNFLVNDDISKKIVSALDIKENEISRQEMEELSVALPNNPKIW